MDSRGRALARDRSFRRWAAAIGLALGTIALGGCGSTISQLPLLGTPDGAPRATGETPPTPGLVRQSDTDADRPPVLSPAEREALEADLLRAGERAADDRRRRISRPD